MSDLRANANRSKAYIRQREMADMEMERKRKKIQEQSERNANIAAKFASENESVEAQIRAKTYGLVTLEQMKAAAKAAEEERSRKVAEAEKAQKAKKKKKNRKMAKVALSFDLEEEGDTDDVLEKVKSKAGNNIKRLGKNPEVDTSFIPDVEREEELRKKREELRKEWLEKQAALKNEPAEIVYSYWDGSGHRRTVQVKKGDTVGQFLQAALKDLRPDFNDLKSTTSDQLMYIKEDTIVPQHYTFYDLIVTKARARTGPLFDEKAIVDVHVRSDATIEKETHIGKVCTRNWYEKHKHIFPASSWENYDPIEYAKYQIEE
ncbi:hypothetical protein PTSG_08633 [Salpingoeca rosetta]|uniref:FAM50A/XAP5 C-terminal domain-containing protein n=1 Tax=Salpingoeca rosetta (strain ATCC 50818 / BSB-021) TaxID=946362 RepID=F2UK86_SALR5|nr:uncharacterized protein PTSG_08633 [Salpingoeca rosetta]EGD77535.1 hypothetical protein PTSG_08633 [Salpingoeca rosetta]|eukprot:XP_004990423.1 hypothetical protein PTSG_08633 [Salpingoeca rosetta]